MTRFSAASSSMALRTVPWLTLKRLASSISLGINSPGFHSPVCRLCVIRALICWYSGEKVGELPAAGRPAPPALAPVALAAPLAAAAPADPPPADDPPALEAATWLDELGGTGFI